MIRNCQKQKNIARTVADIAQHSGNDIKLLMYELRCQAEEAIMDLQQNEAYTTMFRKTEEQVSETVSADDGNTDDEEENDEECPTNDDENDVYHKCLDPEDF